MAEDRTAEPRTPEPKQEKLRVRVADTRVVREPAFWFGFEVSWAKLVLTRFVVFALLAIDALLQIRHAPRYGAGGFNVAQLPGLDWIGPDRTTYEVGELILAYLFVLVALGVVTRFVLVLATVLYAWLYFGSQLDSYQHHYLVALVLLLACFVPWERPASATPSTPVQSCALRLILVQLGIMYFWAAISKMNHDWTGGITLGTQIKGSVRSLIDATVGMKRASKLVIGAELSLALLVWNRRAWFIAAPLGIAFHAGILATDLEIGLFAWLMLGLYILVVPDRVWIFLAELPPIMALRGVWARASERVGKLWVPVLAIALLGGILVLAFVRFEYARIVGGALIFRFVLVTAFRIKRGQATTALALGHIAGLLTWVAVDRSTTIAEDYYRFFGGTSRRFGTPEQAEHAYRRLTEVAPDKEAGHYHLGRALLNRGAVEEGLFELHEAQRVGPDVARAFVVEAQWLAVHGRREEALEKAREGQRAEPDDAAAANLLNTLSAGGAGVAPTDD